jgi:DNA-directed RNA polymerase subunit H (RpoH/RPB5)
MAESIIINFEYNELEKIEIIVSNILKMLIERKLILNDNYKTHKNQIISKIKNTNFYNIELDNPDKDNKKIYLIQFINENIINISKGSQIYNNINKNLDIHKIIIVNSISNRQLMSIINLFQNIEVFTKTELMCNLIDHIYIPKHYLLNAKEKEKFYEEYNITNTEIPKCFTMDPVAKYYNAKSGDIFRIIRASELTGESIYYRLVIKGNVVGH